MGDTARAAHYAGDARSIVASVTLYEDVHPDDAPCLESLLRAVPGIAWRGHEVPTAASRVFDERSTVESESRGTVGEWLRFRFAYWRRWRRGGSGGSPIGVSAHEGVIRWGERAVAEECPLRFCVFTAAGICEEHPRGCPEHSCKWCEGGWVRDDPSIGS